MLDWKDASPHELRLLNVYEVLFHNHFKLLEFLFEPQAPQLREPPEALLQKIGMLSSGEKVLIQVALDLWDGSGRVYLWDVLHRLDRETLKALMQGLEYLKLIPTTRASGAAPIKIGMVV